MEMLIGIMIFFGIGYLAIFVGFIYGIYFVIDYFVDLHRYKNYQSGKSQVFPKHPERYVWN